LVVEKELAMNVGDLRWQPFREANFRHNCAKIELTKNDSSVVTYHGPGEVWQDEDGVLSFKCFARADHGTPIDSILNNAALEPGKLIPDSAYYSIQFTTFENTTWSADNVWVNLSYKVTTGDVIIVGKLRTLRQVHPARHASNYNVMRLLFLAQRHEDWRSFNDAVIRLENIGCTIKFLMQRDSDVLIEITGNSKLPQNFDVRVVEALRFVLAKVVHLSVVAENAEGMLETTLISPVRESETTLFPPLNAPKGTPDLCRLFERYLTFVNSETSSEFVHPCSMYLRSACEASANSFEAEAIGLCVAVEGIANLLPFKKDESEDQPIVNARNAILKLLEEMDTNHSVKDRIRGALGRLHEVRAIDRLQPLVRSGHLHPSCLAAWKKLRDKGVHPKQSKLEEFEDEQVQELLDRMHEVYVCMYQITFALIGYEGTFSNYAAKRFPIETYPLTAIAK
jgi:hypothetical protein